MKTELVRNDLDVARRAEKVEADAELEGIDVDEVVKEFKMVKGQIEKRGACLPCKPGFSSKHVLQGRLRRWPRWEPSSAHHIT